MRSPLPSPQSSHLEHPYRRARRSARNLLPQITAEARKYAVKELARRAGVTRDFFQRWEIEISPERTLISFGPDVHGTISFPHRSGTSLAYDETVPVVRARWLHDPSGPLPLPDLIVPFAEKTAESNGPLYFAKTLGGLTCRHDLLSSVVFTLSRTEETVSGTFDEHGRFLATASLAVQQEFLERPIIDEHGIAFQQAISALVPNWRPSQPPLYLHLTHDIDDVGIPFKLHTTLAHTVKRGRPWATVRDCLARISNANPAELQAVRRLEAISRARRLRSTFLWKASSPGPRDSGYDPGNTKVQSVIHHLQNQGCELGVHPGYDTFRDRANLAAEVERLRSALGVENMGGRQHYLRWTPLTWEDWEACGLLYDSSVGFAERFGFRAGTSHPYRPWCFRENRELELIEIPLILMDCTPVKYMKLSLEQSRGRIQAMIQRVERTGGVFSLLWHNTPLLDPDYDGWYEAILTMLAGAKPYDVPSRPQQLW